MSVWFITSGCSDLAIGARVSTRKVRGVRPLFPLAIVLLTALSTAGVAAPAARPGVPGTVLVTVFVGENATRTMPAALWRSLAVEYVGAKAVTAEDGATLADEARCRSAHALYAVLATFERATRLPGLGQDTDRAYGVARFTVRNCLTGAVAPAKTIALESDPLAEADRGDVDPNAERTWGRAIRATLAHHPLGLTMSIARVVRVEGSVVYIEGGSFRINQVLHAFADANAHPHLHPIDLVVLDFTGNFAQCSIIGNGTAHVGDYVEAAPK